MSASGQGAVMELKKLTAAWIRREQMHEDPATTAYRIFHGHGDGEPRFDADRLVKRSFFGCAKTPGSTWILWPNFIQKFSNPIRLSLKTGLEIRVMFSSDPLRAAPSPSKRKD